MSKYRKTLAAFGGFLAVVASALADGELTGAEGSAIIVAAATVVAVFAFPNASE